MMMASMSSSGPSSSSQLSAFCCRRKQRRHPHSFDQFQRIRVNSIHNYVTYFYLYIISLWHRFFVVVVLLLCIFVLILCAAGRQMKVGRQRNPGIIINFMAPTPRFGLLLLCGKAEES